MFSFFFSICKCIIKNTFRMDFIVKYTGDTLYKKNQI